MDINLQNNSTWNTKDTIKQQQQQQDPESKTTTTTAKITTMHQTTRSGDDQNDQNHTQRNEIHKEDTNSITSDKTINNNNNNENNEEHEKIIINTNITTTTSTKNAYFTIPSNESSTVTSPTQSATNLSYPNSISNSVHSLSSLNSKPSSTTLTSTIAIPGQTITLNSSNLNLTALLQNAQSSHKSNHRRRHSHHSHHSHRSHSRSHSHIHHHSHHDHRDERTITNGNDSSNINSTITNINKSSTSANDNSPFANNNSTISQNQLNAEEESDLNSKLNLIIVCVGLPARGKSYITKKLQKYLNWMQYNTKIFNVGNTRRLKKGKPSDYPIQGPVCKEDKEFFDNHETSDGNNDESYNNSNNNNNNTDPTNDTSHDANFFDPSNKENFNVREQWAKETLDQLIDYLMSGQGNVGIFDATNTTKLRRKWIIETINKKTKGTIKVLFLESICTDQAIIEKNIRLKLSGPDYKKMDPNLALQDFRNRLKNYEKVYETIDDEEELSNEKFDIQYIKIINAGRKVVSYNISGYLSSQVVIFLLNFNLSERQIFLTSSGESEFNFKNRKGGDSGLTKNGEAFARELPRFISKKRQEFKLKQLNKEYIKENSFRLIEFDEDKENNNNNNNEETPDSATSKESTDEYLNIEPEFNVWSSNLIRAIHTASFFNDEEYHMKSFRMLNDLGCGSLDGMKESDFRNKFPEEYRNQLKNKLSYRFPGLGGESYLDVISRLRPMIIELERLKEHVLIVSHRVITRVLLGYFMGLSKEMLTELDVQHGFVYCIEPKPYGLDLKIWQFDEMTHEFYEVDEIEIMNKKRHRGSIVLSNSNGTRNGEIIIDTNMKHYNESSIMSDSDSDSNTDSDGCNIISDSDEDEDYLSSEYSDADTDTSEESYETHSSINSLDSDLIHSSSGSEYVSIKKNTGDYLTKGLPTPIKQNKSKSLKKEIKILNKKLKNLELKSKDTSKKLKKLKRKNKLKKISSSSTISSSTTVSKIHSTNSSSINSPASLLLSGSKSPKFGSIPLNQHERSFSQCYEFRGASVSGTNTPKRIESNSNLSLHFKKSSMTNLNPVSMSNNLSLSPAIMQELQNVNHEATLNRFSNSLTNNLILSRSRSHSSTHLNSGATTPNGILNMPTKLSSLDLQSHLNSSITQHNHNLNNANIGTHTSPNTNTTNSNITSNGSSVTNIHGNPLLSLSKQHSAMTIPSLSNSIFSTIDTTHSSTLSLNDHHDMNFIDHQLLQKPNHNTTSPSGNPVNQNNDSTNDNNVPINNNQTEDIFRDKGYSEKQLDDILKNDVLMKKLTELILTKK
ncbi:kinase activity protein [[Candida] boidinii]|nr:kinase activity protein [[Candida] boidinii]